MVKCIGKYRYHAWIANKFFVPNSRCRNWEGESFGCCVDGDLGDFLVFFFVLGNSSSQQKSNLSSHGLLKTKNPTKLSYTSSIILHHHVTSPPLSIPSTLSNRCCSPRRHEERWEFHHSKPGRVRWWGEQIRVELHQGLFFVWWYSEKGKH